ncbi:hypothetical protein, partial [Prosthecobacter sp.]|uniref:hypothetical protein n=1 Tax=Prosthecobacter sp. TaxID=1965333 RepID=UPI0024878F05
EGLEYGDYEDCQFCEHEQIRYVHILAHPEYSDTIRVGCVCACNLTNDYVEPKRRERLLRNRTARRSRFPNRRSWRVNRQGGKTIKLDNHRITVGLKRGRYRVWIDGEEGTLYYDDERGAMLRAYDRVQKTDRCP